MKSVITLEGKNVILIFKDFDQSLDVDDLTKIDYSNLYGETITISVLLSKIGKMKGEVEYQSEMSKLEIDIAENEAKSKLRKEASEQGGKFTVRGVEYKLTEKALDDAANNDKEVLNAKRKHIEDKRTLNDVNSFLEGLRSKSRKLEVLMPKVTPEEFYDELVEGTVNGILIKKK